MVALKKSVVKIEKRQPVPPEAPSLNVARSSVRKYYADMTGTYSTYLGDVGEGHMPDMNRSRNRPARSYKVYDRNEPNTIDGHSWKPADEATQKLLKKVGVQLGSITKLCAEHEVAPRAVVTLLKQGRSWAAIQHMAVVGIIE